MSYVPRPNASGDTLRDSRDPIRGNFVILQDRFNENHVNLGGTSGGGKHQFLQMPENLQNDIPATASNEAGFYAKVGTSPAEANLFFRGESSGFEYQMTKSIAASTGDFANTNFTTGNTNLAGWTFLPGGMLMQYGTTDSLAIKANTTITFPVAFTTGCFSVTASMIRATTGDVALSVNTVGTTTFRILNTSSTSGRKAYWMAIGV